MPLQASFDPYEVLIQLQVRMNLAEQHIKELEFNTRSLNRIIEEQARMIRQSQQNEQVMSEALGHLLLKQPK
jgi:hypothetical protein